MQARLTNTFSIKNDGITASKPGGWTKSPIACEEKNIFNMMIFMGIPELNFMQKLRTKELAPNEYDLHYFVFLTSSYFVFLSSEILIPELKGLVFTSLSVTFLSFGIHNIWTWPVGYFGLYVSNPELETCIPEVCSLVCMMRFCLYLDWSVTLFFYFCGSVVQSFCCMYSWAIDVHIH